MSKMLGSNVSNIGAESCSFWDSIVSPLYDPKHNELNPCFIACAGLAINGVVGVFALSQMALVVFNNKYGHFRIKYSFGSPYSIKSVGIYQLFKLNSVLLQTLLLLVLLDLTFISSTNVETLYISTNVLLSALVIFPFHYIEPTRTVVSSASLMIYWCFSFILNGIILAQDTFASHKVFLPEDNTSKSVVCTIEVGLFLNSMVIFLLQATQYRPSIELTDYYNLNGWDICTVRNIISEFSYSSLNSLIKKVYKTQHLDLSEVPPLHISNLSDANYQKLMVAWNDSLEKVRSPTFSQPLEKPLPKLLLLGVLFKLHWGSITLAIVLNMFDLVSNFGLAFLLQYFILYFTNSHNTDDEGQPAIVGFSIVIAMFILAIAKATFVCKYTDIFTALNGKLQGSLSSMVYQKGLRLSSESRKQKSSGELINMAIDISTIADAPKDMVESAIMPVRFILAMLSLQKIIGSATWLGVLVACIMIPFCSKVSTSIFGFYGTSMKIKDERTKFTSEILNSIKTVKLLSWEHPMLKRLFKLRREKEVVMFRKIGIYNCVAMFMWLCVPFAVSAACLFAFTSIIGGVLVPSVAFPAISLFEVLTQPILIFPDSISSTIKTIVSLKRVQTLFVMEELAQVPKSKNLEQIEPDVTVSLKNSTFLWSSGDSTNPRNVALKNINFVAKKGELTCIVGRVGSGKSTLLKSILGELPVAKNPDLEIFVKGSVAYCSQNPWIANATVRENILFGCKFDKVFYDLTVSACQLLSDYEVLPDGDRTVVGEKGISLSGGQKARIALARSVYSRADLVILDDVLSAVDAHVGKDIINNVLGPEGILSSKTVLLATNSLRVLQKANSIVLLKNGTITERGNLQEIFEKGSDLAELIKEYDNLDEESDVESRKEALDAILENEEAQDFQLSVDDQNLSLAKLERAVSMVSYSHNYDDEDDNEVTRKTGNSVETGAKGALPFGIYLEYFRTCGIWYIIFYFCCFGVNVALGILANYTLKSWSEKNLDAGFNQSPIFYLTLYIALGFVGSSFTLLGGYVLWGFAVPRGAKHFHDNMATNVLRAPMSFFETTPVGRLINRFSDDINVIDHQLLWACMGLGNFSLKAFGVLAVIVFNLPVMFFVIFVLMFMYNKIRKYYIPAARELKRMTSAQKSPVFAHLLESLNGIDTIRAYGQLERFFFKYQRFEDTLVRVESSNRYSKRWLAMRLQTISAFIQLSTSLFLLSTLGTDYELSSGLVGFIMVSAMGITSDLNGIIRFWADVESKSVAVERVLEYSNLPQEAAEIVEDNRPPSQWPQNGSIRFENYETKYRANLDPVLKNITLEMKPMEKIGVVGRTGAGKSTLSLALFRIIEGTSGSINIDNIDTNSIGLFDLRLKLNIIPQDSQCLEGTIRQNLDPFEKYSDEQLWNVLEIAHLKAHVSNMNTNERNFEETGLSARVFDGGSNLSSGQRQLLALARALLNPSKILVLDEATAAVDSQTDKIIQETIREEFGDKTIITIAHRIDTILDSDRILFLDRGEVKEFDSPKVLLANKNSLFYSLCKEGGFLVEESTDL